jgi:hypothetical protein
LFAAFLGYNPMRTLLGAHVLAGVGPARAATLTGKTFFPNLISGPFHYGLVIAFSASGALCAGAAIASWWAGNCGEIRERKISLEADDPLEVDVRLARLGS